MTDSLLKFLEQQGLDIADCRGQSYDNALNMAGRYKGMQALILEKTALPHIFHAAHIHST
jgi:hypothetical protein